MLLYSGTVKPKSIKQFLQGNALIIFQRRNEIQLSALRERH